MTITARCRHHGGDQDTSVRCDVCKASRDLNAWPGLHDEVTITLPLYKWLLFAGWLTGTAAPVDYDGAASIIDEVITAIESGCIP